MCIRDRLYGGLLGFIHWRVVALMAAGAPLTGMFVAKFKLRDSPSGQKNVTGAPLSFSDFTKSSRAVMSEPNFWTTAGIHCCSTTIRRVDILLGVFFHDTTTLSTSQAGMFTTVFSVGYLIGLLLLGSYFVAAPYPRKRQFMLGLYSTCITALLLLAVASGSQPIPNETARLVLEGLCVLLMAMSTGVQYYLIPSAYAAQYGGPNTGMVSSWLDGIGYASTVLLYPVLGVVVDSVSWQPVWLVIAGIQLIGVYLMLRLMPKLYQANGGEDEAKIVHGILEDGFQLVESSPESKQSIPGSPKLDDDI
eukprot:TRINITY_DN2143_c0_g1_i2.p1 TRINITY_DN2143_c0_g1~~TRINITY_DN2143_c0_g1_i2.p1  ORF type:complete len:306 (-),score=43.78 TRINITY_DN2143_c0_g1_i2:51-968(-)